VDKTKAQRQAESAGALRDERERAVKAADAARERHLELPDLVVEAVQELVRAEIDYAAASASAAAEFADRDAVYEASSKLTELIKEVLT